MKTLVLGVGNLLLGDEGVGVHVVRALEQRLPPDVVALEVGTAFLDALPAIEKADRIIVVDAMQAGGAPGSVYRIPFEDCARPECIASLHGFDLSRTLYLAGRSIPPEVIVIGIEPSRIAWGLEVSPEVRDAIPAVISAIRADADRRHPSRVSG
jgi:hydrogenase maturation protease